MLANTMLLTAPCFQQINKYIVLKFSHGFWASPFPQLQKTQDLMPAPHLAPIFQDKC